jgi:hypothetical protein
VPCRRPTSTTGDDVRERRIRPLRGRRRLLTSTSRRSTQISTTSRTSARSSGTTSSGSSGRTYGKGDYVWNAAGPTDGQVWISLVDNNLGIAPAVGVSWALATDTTRVPAEWQWVETCSYVDTLGRKGETLGSTPTPAVNVALGTDRNARLEVFDGSIPAATP